MWYKCIECEHQEERGCIPGVSCGLYLAGLLALPGMMIGFVLSVLRQALGWDGFGWWWLLITPVSIVVGFGLLMPVAIAIEWMEWFAFCRRRCPACGHRRWSHGYTRGFGL